MSGSSDFSIVVVCFAVVAGLSVVVHVRWFVQPAIGRDDRFSGFLAVEKFGQATICRIGHHAKSALVGRRAGFYDPPPNGSGLALQSEPFMKSPLIGAIITAAAATSLVCATAFASGVAVDLAVTGLFHLPTLATISIGAAVLGGDGWFGIWLFRKAFAVEKALASGAGQSKS